MSDEIMDIDEKTFDNILANDQRLFAVEFYTPTCTTCLALLKTCNEISQRYKGKLLIAKVNAQTNPGLAIRYRVLGVPAFKFFKNGKLVEELSGSIKNEKLGETFDRLLQKY